MNHLNNIQNSGFKTPKGYFESLEDGVLNAVNEDAIKAKVKTTGLQTPDNYFESLEDTLLKKVVNTNASPKVISLFNRRNLIYASGIAAAFIILFGLYFNKSETTFDTIELELVEDYISNQDIDSFELAALFKDDELTTETFIDSDLYGDTLEEYLIENTNIEDLIIE